MAPVLAAPPAVPPLDMQLTSVLERRPPDLSTAAFEYALELGAGDHVIIDDPITGPWSVALEEEPLMMGRSLHADIRLEGPMISRRHVMFRFTESGWAIHDERSLNGVWCNGQRVTGDAWHTLRSGDVINVGDWTVLYVHQSD